MSDSVARRFLEAWNRLDEGGSTGTHASDGDRPPPANEARFLTDSEQPSVARSLQALAEVVLGAGYEAPALSQLLGTETIYQPDLLSRPFSLRRAAGGSPLGVAARLFLLEDALPRADAATLLGRDLVADLIELELLTALPDERVRSVVDLFPVDGLLIASDPVFFRDERSGDPAGGSDVYYVGRDSFDLSLAVPKNHVDRALDLCTGTGVQALCAAAHAGEVVGVDVNPRAVRFARANATMNGIGNASFVEGDLFGPVGERRFDLVIANPPFVAAPPGEPQLYRDGGPLGDGVFLDVIAGLAGHLTPRGEAYSITEFVRRPDEEDVLVAALDGAAFDVLVVDLAHYDVRTFITHHALGALLHGGWEAYAAEVERWLDHATDRGIETLSYSIVAMRPASSFRLTRQTVPAGPSAPGVRAASLIEAWRART